MLATMLRLALSAVMLIMVGCSGEETKRVGYETLQNIREKECSRTPSVECEQRERLEVYDDKRRQLD